VTIAQLLAGVGNGEAGSGVAGEARARPGDRGDRRHMAAAVHARRAAGLGFAPHESVVELIRAFVEDDLEATRATGNCRLAIIVSREPGRNHFFTIIRDKSALAR
jgi:nucleoside-diphosphate-sugar epimerase